MVVQEGSEERLETSDKEERVNGSGEKPGDDDDEEDASDNPEEAELELDRQDFSPTHFHPQKHISCWLFKTIGCLRQINRFFFLSVISFLFCILISPHAGYKTAL